MPGTDDPLPYKRAAPSPPQTDRLRAEETNTGEVLPKNSVPLSQPFVFRPRPVRTHAGRRRRPRPPRTPPGLDHTAPPGLDVRARPRVCFRPPRGESPSPLNYLAIFLLVLVRVNFSVSFS